MILYSTSCICIFFIDSHFLNFKSQTKLDFWRKMTKFIRFGGSIVNYLQYTYIYILFTEDHWIGQSESISHVYTKNKRSKVHQIAAKHFSTHTSTLHQFQLVKVFRIFWKETRSIYISYGCHCFYKTKMIFLGCLAAFFKSLSGIILAPALSGEMRIISLSSFLLKGSFVWYHLGRMERKKKIQTNCAKSCQLHGKAFTGWS